MYDAPTQGCFNENAEVKVRVGEAVFSAILETVTNDIHVIVIEGRIRVGGAVTVCQLGFERAGRVQQCQSLADGWRCRLIVEPRYPPREWNAGFDWPTNAFPHSAEVC